MYIHGLSIRQLLNSTWVLLGANRPRRRRTTSPRLHESLEQRLLLSLVDLVSQNSDEVPANNYSVRPSISGDGRFVAFQSYATNLAPGVSPSLQQIYVRDLLNGTTQIVSSGPNGPGDRNSTFPSISADGRYVAFVTSASNFPFPPGFVQPSPPDALYVYRKDLQTGDLQFVGVSSLFDSVYVNSAISADGRYVAYAKAPSGSPSDPQVVHIVRWDTETSTEVIASVDNGGNLQIGFEEISISGDGNRVAFLSNSASLVPGPSGPRQVVIRDIAAAQTFLVSTGPNGPSNGLAERAELSFDGRFVVFETSATNLSPTVTNGNPHVFLRDTLAGTTTLIDMLPDGSTPILTQSGSISGDGRFVFYAARSQASREVTVWDRVTNITRTLKTRPQPSPSTSPTSLEVSGDGLFVAFQSTHTDLVDAPVYANENIYRRAANLAPIGLSPTTASVPENSPPGTLVATLSSQDNDIGDQFTYSLVTGAGDTDNALFQIAGNHLLTVGVLDYEAQSSRSVRIRTTDLLGGTFEAAVTITVTNAVELAMLRGRSPASQLHFFTTNSVEFNGQVAAGMVNEGGPNGAFSVLDGTATGATPIYRLFNPRQGSHYLTANLLERDALLALGTGTGGSDGWIAEGIDGYLHAQSQPGTAEVFHLYDRVTGSHLFTTNPQERDAALTSLGSFWQQHTSLGYVFVSSPAQPSATSAPVSAAPAVAARPEAELPVEVGSPSSDDFAGLASLIRVDESVPSTDLSQPGEDSPFDAPAVATLETYGTQEPEVPLPWSVTATPVGDDTDGE